MDVMKLVLGLVGAGALGYAGWELLKPSKNGEPPVGTAIIFGTVIDTFPNAPLPGVKVKVAPSAGGVKEATTDADGEYSIESLPLGACVITFTKGGYGTETRNDIILVDGATLVDEWMTTGTGTATLWGYVLDADTEDPIEGIRVDYPGGMVFSDADGKYILEDIWHRTGSALVAQDTNYPVAKRYEDYSELVDTFAGEETQHDIYMEPIPTNGPPPPPTKATLYGIVVDLYSGDPVSGVTVSVDGYNTTTDGNGEYLIAEMEPGYYTATFSKAGYETRSYSVPLSQGGEYPLGVVLTPGGVGAATLSGVVTDTDGAPLAGAYVDVGSYPPAHQAVTDSSGYYSISGIVAGTYWLTFAARVGGYAGKTNIEKTLYSGDNVQDAEIELTLIPTAPTSLTVCRLSIDYLTLGGYLLGDYGSNVYRGAGYIGGFICPLSLPYNTPIVGYWTAPQEVNIPAPTVKYPNGQTATLSVYTDVMTPVGIRRRYGPLVTSQIGIYEVEYMGEVSYWTVDPWAEIESFTYETDSYPAIYYRRFFATINILREWDGDWWRNTGHAASSNLGQLGLGQHDLEWDESGRSLSPVPPYLLLSRQNVPNAFYDSSEQCATVLNRGVINIPQLIGVVAAFKAG